MYKPEFKTSYLHPKYWGTWLGIGFAAILAFLPFRLRDKLAEKIALRMTRLNNLAKRRAVINLQECFPEKSDEERQHILKQCYITGGCVMLGMASIMMRSKHFLEKRTVFFNEEHLTQVVENGDNVVLLVPHGWAIDYPGVQLASRGLPVAAMFKKQKNPVADWLLNKQRLKYGGRLHERAEGIKPFIKSIKEGYLGYYLPDEDHGPDYSVFVPFFAAEKATLSGLGKMARLAKAKIVPLMPIYNRETGNFEVHVLPALDPFPTGSEEDDARMMNAAIEQFLEGRPEQYMWNLKLLRSKPDGTTRY
ncbi:lauroyl-Kdo(2)-lipid IV(A) myristoyltransferase [Parasalinivibrio latis]|uniref:lauroyl-Kdo(2)-lipid IV(A) myristoyltransferase n=1 Tax=Parasalinivibrio latis TaxID=2952610 RepID=UPI0030DE0EE0